MSRTYYLLALVCLTGLAAAEPSYLPGSFFPIEHRSDLQKRSDQTTEDQESLKNIQDEASLNGYELQVIPKDQFTLVENDSYSISLLGLVWQLLPSPWTVIKFIGKLIWKVVKILIPIDLILLGMASVVGFCAFTPYCTLIIEKPFVRSIRSFKENIPYIDEIETFFYKAYDVVHELQSIE